MAEENIKLVEREYTIPLRKAFLKAQKYRRTFKAIQAIKKFIAKHMKIEERDLSKVKLNVDLNNQLWLRGRKNPPAKIKVKARKEGENVLVDFNEVPEAVKFKRTKMDKRHKKSDTPEVSKKDEKSVEESTDEKKEIEKEKELAVAEKNQEEIEKEVKKEKHTINTEAKSLSKEKRSEHNH
jgi:large subunit ribosomal protein L31e